MRKTKLGHSDVETSRIILGTWQAGQEYWVGIQEDEIIRAIHKALDSGITGFDTAEEYGEGRSEQTLGKALEGRREKAVLLTKVFSNHLRPKEIRESCHQSLKNLRTDYLDLYQIHWPSGKWGSDRVPIKDSLSELAKLKEEGKIRAIGVSNFNLNELKEACRVAPNTVDTIQPPYSILWREAENELIPFCQTEGISVLAYSPLAQGFLTGKFQKGHQFREGDHRSKNKLFDSEVFPRVLKVVESLKKVADSAGITLAQLALAWVISKDKLAAIAGARNSQQVEDNARAGSLTLSEEQLLEIDEASRELVEEYRSDPLPWHWDP